VFIGHYAVALAAKKAAPRTSLGTLFLGAQLVDLLWPVFILSGLEHVRIVPGITVVTPLDFYDYPFSHSLLAVLLWGLGLGAVYFAARRNMRASIVLGLCVVSHWVLDLLTHRPDLPLSVGGDMRWGLGLWNSLAGTVIVETALFLAGIVIYLKTTHAITGVGKYGFWALVGVLFAIYIVNVFGPPPPNVSAIGYAGNLSWLFVIWAYWVDRNRRIGLEQHQADS
jgi:FtsH-binding integral membrane protein